MTVFLGTKNRGNIVLNTTKRNFKKEYFRIVLSTIGMFNFETCAFYI